MTDPVLTDIPQKEIETLLILCGFEERRKQGGSHVRFKLKGSPNSLVVLSGHGKNPMTPFYQVRQVRKLLLRLGLVED